MYALLPLESKRSVMYLQLKHMHEYLICFNGSVYSFVC